MIKFVPKLKKLKYLLKKNSGKNETTHEIKTNLQRWRSWMQINTVCRSVIGGWKLYKYPLFSLQHRAEFVLPLKWTSWLLLSINSMWSRLCYWCILGTISVTQILHVLLFCSVYPLRAPNAYHMITSDSPSTPEWSHSAASIQPSYNPTTMDKTILMHREARGPAQPLTCRQRGSAVIYMLMVLLEGVKTGQGGMLCCQLRGFLREHGTVQSIRAASVEAHLLVLIWSTKSIYTLLNQTCRMHAPPPLPHPLLWHMDTARAFQTQIS